MTIHGEWYFSTIVRDDASSEGSQRQEYNEVSVVNQEQPSQERLEGKGAVFSALRKACAAIVRSVNLAVSSSGVKIDISSTEVENDEEIPFSTTVVEKEEGIPGPSNSPEHLKLSLRKKNLPNHVDVELVAAGWPSWLIAVAKESLIGWIPRRADSFEKLNKIGGKHSLVYRARDILNGNIVALKKVRFDSSKPETLRFIAREILILRRLNHPNIMKLKGLVTSKRACSLYLVFDYIEHDLAGLVANTGIKFTEPQVKSYMQQLLLGLEHCHHRGILHRDIKGSDLLLDKAGILKIADFGSASYFNPYHKQPMTSPVVSLWYRSPELLLGATVYGVAVDLWSVGCILAELLAGKPIMRGRTEVEQLDKIFKLCGSPSEKYWKQSKLPLASIFMPQQPYERRIAPTFKDFSPPSLSLIETLLAIDPAERKTATAALKSEYFTTKPYACEPSSLPQYPSKNMDARLRDEEAKRLHTAGNKGNGDGVKRTRTRSRAVKAILTPETNVDAQASFEDSRLTKSTSENSHSTHQDRMRAGPSNKHKYTTPTNKKVFTLVWSAPLLDTVAVDSPRLKKNILQGI